MAKITHIWIPVSDMEKAKEFYGNKLGLQVTAERVFDTTVITMLNSTDNDSVILIHDPSLVIGVQAGLQITVGWAVSDLEKIKDEFNEKGVVFEGEIFEAFGLRLLNMRDPDGHLIQLTQVVEE